MIQINYSEVGSEKAFSYPALWKNTEIILSINSNILGKKHILDVLKLGYKDTRNMIDHVLYSFVQF